MLTIENLRIIAGMYGPAAAGAASDVVELRKAAHALLADMCTTQVLSSNTPHSAQATTKLLLPVLLALRPLDDQLQCKLLLAALASHPVLQLAYLKGSPLFSAPPGTTLRYVAASDLMCRILSIPLSGDPSCVLGADSLGHALADLIAPAKACGSILSAGMQHTSTMVRHVTTRSVIRILMRLGDVQKGTWQRALPIGTFEEARRLVRARAPDFQVLIAARQKIAVHLQSGGAQGAAAQLLLPRVLQAMAIYLERFPEGLAESRVDLAKLVAERSTLAHPPVLSQTLSLLKAAPPMSGSWFSAPKADAQAQTHFGCLLFLFARGQDAQPLPKSLRVKLAGLTRKILAEAALVGDSDGEGEVWVHAVGHSIDRAECLEVLSLEASKSVHKLCVQGAEMQSRVGGQYEAAVSPLLLCALQKLQKSEVKPVWEKFISEVASELFHRVSPMRVVELLMQSCPKNLAALTNFFSAFVAGGAGGEDIMDDAQGTKTSACLVHAVQEGMSDVGELGGDLWIVMDPSVFNDDEVCSFRECCMACDKLTDPGPQTRCRTV